MVVLAKSGLPNGLAATASAMLGVFVVAVGEMGFPALSVTWKVTVGDWRGPTFVAFRILMTGALLAKALSKTV